MPKPKNTASSWYVKAPGFHINQRRGVFQQNQTDADSFRRTTFS
ncbi:hypothetical protein WMW72_25545 [Paenibacillus filicis]|uniref:YpzG-like protein n=1 Tax=Paenibacillus filicis TaxID=669464 RepID=A0ABU9DQZ5_9BACL